MGLLDRINSKAPATIEWRDINGKLTPVNCNTGRAATWAAQPGSCEAYLSCPIPEVLYTGPRGNGKTDSLLMDFAQHVGKGWGANWKGVIVRRTFPELHDIIGKTKRWYPLIFGPDNVRYNEGKSVWRWNTGEELQFRHFNVPKDYWNFHGQSFTFIGFEELCSWPTPECYLSLFSCNRSDTIGIPLKIRATTNPYGVGSNWVKRRWRLPVPTGRIIGPIINDSLGVDGKVEPPRVAIHGLLQENKILMQADPGYIDRIRASAASPAQASAWIDGSWDIIAGGMFDDLWEPRIHIVTNLEKLPLRQIPPGWRIDRSYDHGQSKPFSVGWWAESNGEPLKFNGGWYGTVKGDLFRIREWYGCKPNRDNEGLRLTATAIAQGINDRETDFRIQQRVVAGVADSSIFDGSPTDPTISVANDMRKEGILWLKADKSSGSRIQGWQQIRTYLQGAIPDSSGYREKPGLFCLPQCRAFIRTLPALPRDVKVPDDADSDAEDHAADEARYRLRYRRSTVRTEAW